MVLLDTSALMVHFDQDPGWEIVEDLLFSGKAWVSAVTWLELRVILERKAAAAELVAVYQESVAGTVDVTAEVAEAAFAIRRATASTGRVPAMESLIAASAKVKGYRLLHRDAHLGQIPQTVVTQTQLPPTK